MAIERRAEYATEFMAQAYHNLRYLVSPMEMGPQAQGPGDFTVMGSRAAFYVSEEAASAINDLTTAYAGAAAQIVASMETATIPEDHFGGVKSKIDLLNRLLRAEVGVERRSKLRAKFAHMFLQLPGLRNLTRGRLNP